MSQSRPCSSLWIMVGGSPSVLLILFIYFLYVYSLFGLGYYAHQRWCNSPSLTSFSDIFKTILVIIDCLSWSCYQLFNKELCVLKYMSISTIYHKTNFVCLHDCNMIDTCSCRPLTSLRHTVSVAICFETL